MSGRELNLMLRLVVVNNHLILLYDNFSVMQSGGLFGRFFNDGSLYMTKNSQCHFDQREKS
jgi:hypothetical protein